MTPKNETDAILYDPLPEDEVDLGEYLAVLIESKWLIALITALTVALGGAFIFIARPIYATDALLQVEETATTLNSLEQVSSLFEGETPVNGEIEILNSRSVLGKVIDKLHLDIAARPAYFPLIGEAIARRYEGEGVSAPWFGLARYAWGGERIEVGTLLVPESLLGERLTLVAEKEGRYRLLGPEQELLLKSKVGERAAFELPDGQSLSLFVSALKARPGTHFELVRRSQLSAISQLQERFSASEKGKQSGILQLQLTGPDPILIQKVLNEIADVYVRQNVEKRSAEAEKTLNFLEGQLPALKEQMEAAADALNAYRFQKGSIDLDLETQGLLSSIINVEAELTQLQQKREEVRQKFKPTHPTLIALDAQIARLQKDLAAMNQKVGKLPETQQVILRLSRDAEVSTQLYTTLLNSAQELRIAKAGTIGNARIVDYALLPEGPVKPNKKLILALAFVMGLFLGVVTVFMRRALQGGVEDPNLLEQQLGLSVYSTIPRSGKQLLLEKQRLRKNPRTGSGSASTALLCLNEPKDQAIESLRSLRTTLHFALLEARNNIILITGPAPQVGKSFVSANLGAVLASSGKKILLIDADLRNGSLHRYMNRSRGSGLSELISDKLSLDQVVHSTECEGMDFIPSGSLPPNPAELLLHKNFTLALEKLDNNYDHILIDSPPILAVTDAAIIGRMAGATLMVVRAGRHSMRELEQSVKQLKQAGVNLRGIIFNDIEVLSSRYAYGRKYVYQYAYGKR